MKLGRIDTAERERNGMATCPFNRGFTDERCTAKAENLEHLLGHVRKAHGAVAWTKATLVSAINKKRGE